MDYLLAKAGRIWPDAIGVTITHAGRAIAGLDRVDRNPGERVRVDYRDLLDMRDAVPAIHSADYADHLKMGTGAPVEGGLVMVRGKKYAISDRHAAPGDVW